MRSTVEEVDISGLQVSSMLTDEERRALLLYCGRHAVATCCGLSLRMEQLVAVVIPIRRDALCPVCRTPLVREVRGHVATCRAIPENIRTRSRELQAATALTRKRSEELMARADLLAREAEEARGLRR